MNIVCTGTSCSGRKELMADFEALCDQKGLNIGFFNGGAIFMVVCTAPPRNPVSVSQKRFSIPIQW